LEVAPFTLGAGPDFQGLSWIRLVSGMNRPTDVSPHDRSQMSRVDIGGRSEKDVIRDLILASHTYNNRLYYDVFATPGGPGQYNSNSYALGLLNALGLGYHTPALPLPGQFNVMPAHYFGR